MAFIQQAIALIVQVLDGSWTVSMGIVPFLLLAFPAAYLILEDRTPLQSVFHAYRAVTLRYGLYILAGTVVAGYAGMILGLSPVLLQVLGAVCILAFLGYGVHHEGVGAIQIEYPDADGWRAWLPYAWILIPPLAVAAVVAWNPLLQSLSAVVFYSYVFWRL